MSLVAVSLMLFMFFFFIVLPAFIICLFRYVIWKRG